VDWRTLVRRTKGTSRKTVVVVCLVVPIALLHFFTGSAYRGPWPEFVNGYLLDILVPFAFYFLLVLPEMSLLRPWPVKALLVFGAGASVEIAQYFGAPILGQTFDPLDFVMYALGVALAASLDTVLFPRLFAFWAPKSSAST
jgi:glycopeptide antibiotics resistance protein